MDESRIHYYYVRDENKRPMVTVAVADFDNDGTVCRGIAICSQKEMPVKKVGRDIARGRLIKAFVNKMNTMPIQRMNDVVDLYDVEFKSAYDDEPTEYELDLIYGDDDFKFEDDDDFKFEEEINDFEMMYDVFTESKY
jgi:hypothetical protein